MYVFRNRLSLKSALNTKTYMFALRLNARLLRFVWPRVIFKMRNLIFYIVLYTDVSYQLISIRKLRQNKLRVILNILL